MNMNLMTSLIPAGAEIFLLIMTCVILIADLLLKQSGRLGTYMLVQLTLMGCALITVGTHSNGVARAFHNMFVDDLMSDRDVKSVEKIEVLSLGKGS